jgi:HPt (histidine-containing phosphotransfer) domain-containing protein
MSEVTTVILVENNPEEAQRFINFAEASGIYTQLFSSSYEAIQWLKKENKADLFIISDDAAPLSAHQTFDYVRQEMKSNIPFAVSGNEGQSVTGSYVFVEKPFTENTISTIKKLLSNNGDNPKVYSLDYLETISGGNHEFLIDCLRTFITSVSGKMAELKLAVANADNKEIGAIAHNIKPSFEMLENTEARDICNKLTYEAETADFPALAAKLRSEFETMESALKNDFQELR